jgi:dTDP-4-dehydrorhamnose 3,5-epimerase
MKINLIGEFLNGIKVVQPDVFEDARGFFMEVFRTDEYERIGLPTSFVQENHSRSQRNVLRGLHFQWEPPMGKLMRVTTGEAFLVAVDIRIGSPTFGKWHGEVVSADNKRQVWAPAGFARGFCVLSEVAEIQYMVTGLYNNKAESGILWNDPAVGIEWPVKEPQLSEKDKVAQTLVQWTEKIESNNFTY